MTKQVERELVEIFRAYKDNKKELATDYNIPVPSGVRYDKIVIKTDNSVNGVEKMTVDYIARREELFKKVYIVDEVLRWFQLEGHGRERFIKIFMIDGESWTKAEMDCAVSRGALSYWRREVLEKAEMVASWVNYF